MKAALLGKTGNISELKENLTFQELPVPSPAPNEVLINLKYASLNRRDLWICKGMYAKISLPVVLGSDGSGIITALGEDVTELAEGDEVIINPSLNWGESEEHQVHDYSILGMPDNGTFEEYICIDQKHVFKKPSNLSLMQASVLPLAGVTAYRACFIKAGIRSGENVLITGIGGGVSTLAMMFALSAGANVYVTSGNEEKLKSAVKLGAKAGVFYQEEKWEKKIHAMMNDRLDIVIDGSGGETISKCLGICDYGARIVSYGATLGTVKDFDIRKVFWKQLKLFGSTMGSDKDFSDMLKYVEENNIMPVIDEIFELTDIHEAFYRMNAGEQLGKIVIKL